MSTRGLVYDIGAYRGEDTAYYLHLGYQVVAVEADPVLADVIRGRCSKEIAEGRCVLLNIGVTPSDGSAPFYLCETIPAFNSFDRAMAARADGQVREIVVTCRALRSLLNEYGVPHFLKLDIEGVDRDCVLSLEPGKLPVFLSFEAGEDALELVDFLSNLGFNRFRLVSQQTWQPVVVPPGGLPRVAWELRQAVRLGLRRLPAIHGVATAAKRWYIERRATEAPSGNSHPAWRFVPGSSGPMPSLESPGWLPSGEFSANWRAAGRGGILESSWFDVHATRSV